MAKNPQIQQRIKEVKNCLVNQIDRKAICEKFGKIWKVSPKAIDHYISAAKKDIAKDAKAMEAKEQDRIDALVENNVLRKLTLQQKFDILHSIASGEFEIEEIIVTKFGFERVKRSPDAYERMKAIEIDNKMSGDNAPDELNIKVGKDIEAEYE